MPAGVLPEMTDLLLADWLKGVGVFCFAAYLGWHYGVRPVARAARRPDLDALQRTARDRGAEDRAADAYSGRYGQGL